MLVARVRSRRGGADRDLPRGQSSFQPTQPLIERGSTDHGRALDQGRQATHRFTGGPLAQAARQIEQHLRLNLQGC
jgi:hypothetical protein